jgi:hypothetical protein
MKPNSIVAATSSIPKLLVESNDVGIAKKKSGSLIEIYFIRIASVVSLSETQIKELDPKKFGDAFEHKVCNVCHKIYPTSFFELNQNGKHNRPIRRPSCKKCREGINGIGISTRDKNTWSKNKPKLSEFTCPICQKTTIPNLTSKIVLNHDHSTGKPTGWICDSCNTGLGRFKDNVEVLQNAIKYLVTNHK